MYMPLRTSSSSHVPSNSRCSAADSPGPLSYLLLRMERRIKWIGGNHKNPGNKNTHPKIRDYQSRATPPRGAQELRPQDVVAQIILRGAREADSPSCVMVSLVDLGYPASDTAFSPSFGMLCF